MNNEQFDPIYWLTDDELKAKTLAAQNPDHVAGIDPGIREYYPDPLSDAPESPLSRLRTERERWDADMLHSSLDAYNARRDAEASFSKEFWRFTWNYLVWAAFGAFCGWVIWLFVVA